MSGRKSRAAIADFEKQFTELERIVARMEQGEQSLDASLADFEKGMALCGTLREALSEAERKVRILVSRNDSAELEHFEPEIDQERASD